MIAAIGAAQYTRTSFEPLEPKAIRSATGFLDPNLKTLPTTSLLPSHGALYRPPRPPAASRRRPCRPVDALASGCRSAARRCSRLCLRRSTTAPWSSHRRGDGASSPPRVEGRAVLDRATASSGIAHKENRKFDPWFPAGPLAYSPMTPTMQGARQRKNRSASSAALEEIHSQCLESGEARRSLRRKSGSMRKRASIQGRRRRPGDRADPVRAGPAPLL